MTATTSAPALSTPMTDFSEFAPPEITRDRILAAIDIGTNSIHMVVVKIQPDLPAFSIIDREK